MDHQKCFVFSPPEARPAKRRRTSESWKQRESVYHTLWAHQLERIQAVLNRSNSATLESIVAFISAVRERRNGTKVPTGLVVAGPSIASHSQFFDRLSQRIVSECDNASCVLISSAECPNLKSLLKVLIKKATTRREVNDEDDDELVAASQRGPKLLDYDLQLLQAWCKEQDIHAVVVAMQDSEPLDGALLAEAVELFSSWLDRIPFVLLFGIATSVDNFHDKLPRSALRCLSGQQFDVVQADEVLEQVFCTTMDADRSLRLGPQLSSMLLDRQKDHIQSVQAFVDALRYAYMSHFYANPLSIFLRSDVTLKDLNEEHFEALRNLPSFRKSVESLLDGGNSSLALELLDSNEELFNFTMQHIESSLRSVIPQMPNIPRSTLYVKAASGNLGGSAIIRELLLSIRKASSDVLQGILQTLQALGHGREFTVIQEILQGLHGLLKDNTDTTVPLRSEHDLRNETMRTTIVASKVELSKQKATLSKNDAAYSKLLATFHDHLDAYFSEMFITPQDLFPYEILMYDLKAPQRAVFMPKPRSVVERALSSPHDYLNCSCCQVSAAGDGFEVGIAPECDLVIPEQFEKPHDKLTYAVFKSTLASTQPPTAVLYQLYLESGSLVNVRDLWSAFNAIVGDENDSEPLTMALFQRALAELKYLGLIRSSRRKADHIAKLAWKGL